MQPTEKIEIEQRPNYRVHYTVVVGDLASSHETHDFYTPFGDEDARQKAKSYVNKQKDYLTNARIDGLERLAFVVKEVEVEKTTPVSLQNP